MNRETIFTNADGRTPDGIAHLDQVIGRTITGARLQVTSYFTREHVTMSLTFDDGTFMDIDFDGHPPTNLADSSGSITVWTHEDTEETACAPSADAVGFGYNEREEHTR